MDDYDCAATHDGTAPAIETAGIQTIYNRPIEIKTVEIHRVLWGC